MKQTHDVRIRCRCGALQGLLEGVSPDGCNHLVCLCDDCQAYGKHLASGFLDENGGSEIVQVAHSSVRLTHGREHLACVRLGPKGMHRWYASCCRTPVANTLGPRSVFAGVLVECLEKPLDGCSLPEVIGPIRERVQGRYGVGELPPGTARIASASFVWFSARLVLRWWLGGSATPSTFFENGAPRVAPQILDAHERAALG